MFQYLVVIRAQHEAHGRMLDSIQREIQTIHHALVNLSCLFIDLQVMQPQSPPSGVVGHSLENQEVNVEKTEDVVEEVPLVDRCLGILRLCASVEG
ncbi:hypothetical protein ACLB2K_015969 [Fragaria x ananassa]